MAAVEFVAYRRGPMPLHLERGQDSIVDALAEKLDARLREWKPETAAEARERIAEVIEFADHEVLDIARSRAAEQEVLDLIRPGPLVLYVPLTTQKRNSPYEVPLPRLPFLDRESVANVRGLGPLPIVRLERKIGRLSREIMERLKDALAFALDLHRASK